MRDAVIVETGIGAAAAVARRITGASLTPSPGWRAVIVMSRGGHLGPDEPGELAGDGGDDDLAVGLACVEAVELAAQAQLRRPRPGR